MRYFCFGSVQDNSNAQGRWCTTVLPRFVIPRSEATWESREGSYDFADNFPAILLGTARLPRPCLGLAMTNPGTFHILTTVRTSWQHCAGSGMPLPYSAQSAAWKETGSFLTP